MGWKVGLYSGGAGGKGGAEGPEYAVWLTIFAFFSTSIRSNVFFFFRTTVGCMIRLISVEMTEKLFWSLQRSATAASVSCMIVALAVVLVFGGFDWGSYEWVLILFRVGFLRRFHGEHELRISVLIVLVVLFNLPH